MDHKAKLLELLKQHGDTIQKFALGGETLGGPTVSTQGDPSRANSGLFGGLNDFLGNQSGFSASGAPIQAGTNTAQLNTAYENAQTGLTGQQDFLRALQAQNGVQNQTNSYNQMQDLAAGRGPNPAQAMLNNSTGQNVAATAALMAGQRGAGANAGLIARQAANAGAGIQQNAAGQAAALQAQQSLNAMTNASNIAQNQVNQQGQATQGYNTAAQNEQNILQGANSAYNNASVGMQSNINNANAMISQGNQAAGNAVTGGIIKAVGGGAVGGLFGAEGGEAGIDIGANVGGSGYTSSNFSGAPDSGGSPGQSVDVTGMPKDKGGGGGIASLLPLLAMLAEGGFIPANVGGGNYNASNFGSGVDIGSPGKSSDVTGGVEDALDPSKKKGGGFPSAGAGEISMDGGEEMATSDMGAIDAFSMMASQGGEVPGPKSQTAKHLSGKIPAQEENKNLNPNTPGATLESILGLGSPYGKNMNQNMSQNMSKGGAAGFLEALKTGGKVPGKPNYPGKNTQKNDTVPALLTPGEMVIPLEIMSSKDPVRGAAEFVAKHLAQHKKMACGGYVKMADGGEAPEIEDDPSGLGELNPMGRTGATLLDPLIDAGKAFFNVDPAKKAEMDKLIGVPASASATPTASVAPASAAAEQTVSNVNLGQENPVSAQPQAQMADSKLKYDPYQGLNTEIAGVSNEAKAMGNIEAEKAKAYQQQAQDLQNIQNQGMELAKSNQLETQNMIDDMKKGHIDPKAYVNSLSGGQKAMTAIGLILGGMGGGLDRSGQNPALELLNKQIDRDISAQIQNRDNKNTIFSAMEKQYGNKKDALNMTHAFYLAKLQNDINTAAAKSGSQIAQARAQQIIGPIQQKLQELHLQTGMRQAAMNGSGIGDPSSLVRYLVPAEHQKKAFEEIEVAQNTAKNAPKILQAFDNAAKKLHAVDFVPGMNNVDQKTFHALLGPTFQDVEGTVRQAAMDNMFGNVTPQFGDSAATLAKKRAAVGNYLDYKSSAPTAKGFGIDLQKFKSTKVNAGGGFKKRD